MLARTVWVPRDVLQVLNEVENARPRDPAARALLVVDRFATLAGPLESDEDADGAASRALAAVEREFPGWEEVVALRRALWPGVARGH